MPTRGSSTESWSWAAALLLVGVWPPDGAWAQEATLAGEPTVIGSPREVALESLIGPLEPDAWRPLGIQTFLKEGWDEVYAPAPGDAPRQTWVNNADGAFYRLFVVSYGFARGAPGGGDVQNGSFFLFTPLSRRLELGWFLPFVVSAPDALATPAAGTWTGIGDLTVAPRVLLAEDRRYTVTSNLYLRVPTGDYRNGNGAATLSPDVEFWANPAGRWVVRGAVGVTIPTNDTPMLSATLAPLPWTGFNASPGSFTSLDARLAVGQYVTAADARWLPNLVYYVGANFHTEVSGGHATYLSLTPGFRFGLGRDWYALGGLEVPLVGPLPFETQTIFQFIKNF